MNIIKYEFENVESLALLLVLAMDEGDRQKSIELKNALVDRIVKENRPKLMIVKSQLISDESKH